MSSSLVHQSAAGKIGGEEVAPPERFVSYEERRRQEEQLANPGHIRIAVYDRRFGVVHVPIAGPDKVGELTSQ